MGQSPSSEDYDHTYTGFPFLQGNAEFTNLHPIPRIWCETVNKIAIKDDVLVSVRAPIGAVNMANQIYDIGNGIGRGGVKYCTALISKVITGKIDVREA